jgi:hypothetical protein
VLVAGDIAAAVVSCLEAVRGACLANQEEVQPVVACSYQEVEAALASAKKTLCSQH